MMSPIVAFCLGAAVLILAPVVLLFAGRVLAFLVLAVLWLLAED